MSLDAMPSAARIRELAASAQLRRFGRIIDPELLDPRERATLTDVPTGGRAIALTGQQPGAPPFTVAAQADPGMTVPIRARRENDMLWLEIETAPRSKKNHGRRVWAKKQRRMVHVPSKAYDKFHADVLGAVAAVRTALFLPLPDREYNIAIRYYVDRYGQAADRPGLDQGLFDALWHADVVSDDWYFRATEGTPAPIFCAEDGEWPPRVECVISPIELVAQ